MFHTSIDIYFFIVLGVRDVFELFMNYCIPLISLSVLQAVGFLKFSCECLKLWLEDVRNSDFLEQSTINKDCDKMFEVYMDILTVYKLTEDTFGPIVS